MFIHSNHANKPLETNDDVRWKTPLTPNIYYKMSSTLKKLSRDYASIYSLSPLNWMYPDCASLDSQSIRDILYYASVLVPF